MTTNPRNRRLAILGAGPIGLEAALYARALGYEPVIYERGQAAENVRRWGFVRMFSPWKLNVSPLGLEAIRCAGGCSLPLDDCPTGCELRELYLNPIARSLGKAIETGMEVTAVSRTGLLKGDSPGGRRRARAPFRILLRTAAGEEEAAADILLDATGVYSNACWLGDGGIPALGETSLCDVIDYHLADILDADRAKFAGKTVLLVGAGFSAATSLGDLLRLARECPGTRVVWARRSAGPDPFPLHSPDPLPERARLAVEGNRAASDPPPWLRVLSGVTVKAVAREGVGVRVDFRPVEGGGLPESVRVDRILANVGYRPSIETFRELQVHQCYASDGPMTLAAALLGRSGGDCLAHGGLGAETLKTPEPDFFILGHKSYGRRNDFLLRTGREQVRDVFRVIAGDSDLDLYATKTDVGGASPPRIGASPSP